jgi:hypothetical protein
LFYFLQVLSRVPPVFSGTLRVVPDTWEDTISSQNTMCCSVKRLLLSAKIVVNGKFSEPPFIIIFLKLKHV